jgi:hypothetical protein
MADTYDLLSLTEAKQALGLPTANPDLDTTVASYVTAVSRLLDDRCGPLVQRTVTNETHSGNGETIIQLAQRPAASITSCTEYQGTTAVPLTVETIGTAPSNGCIVDSTNGLLYRRSGGVDARWYPGRNNITVTYTAGRYASTSVVDARVKRATGMLLRHLWAIDKGSGNMMFGEIEMPIPMGYAIPNRVREMLSDLWRAPVIA